MGFLEHFDVQFSRLLFHESHSQSTLQGFPQGVPL
jgi:hypothetical protein